MKRLTRWSASLLIGGAVALLGVSSVPAAKAASAVPDPCKLITVAELEQLVGRLQGPPKPGDVASGEVYCEYAPVKGPTWINISLHDGDIGAWKKRNGGPHPVALPEFGKDAFMNPGSEGSTDLYAKKGALILVVSLPTGPAAVDKAKAIAKLALSRL